MLPLWKTVEQAFPTFEDRVQTMLSNHERCAPSSSNRIRAAHQALSISPSLRSFFNRSTIRNDLTPPLPIPTLFRWVQLKKSHRAQPFEQAIQPQRPSSTDSLSSPSAVEAERRSSACASTSAPLSSTEHTESEQGRYPH